MKEIEIPKKILDLYEKVGVMSLGERHGIKENYDIYQQILNSLPQKPNLAIEFGYFDKIEFQNFLNNKKLDLKYIQGDGRVNLEYFNFLKNYLLDNQNTKIIYLDEELERNEISRDEQQYIYFLKNFERPMVIICGETHARKEPIHWSEGNIQIPMCFYVKNALGDFPNIRIMPASGACYYMNKITEIPKDDKLCGIIIDKGDNIYEYNFEKATPTTPLE